MQRFIARFVTALAAGAALALPFSSSAATLSGHRVFASGAPNMIYVAAGHLWIRSVDTGAARVIATPWPMNGRQNGGTTGVQWSPDARHIALDDGAARLAVITLANGHTTVLLQRRCPRNCLVPTYSWSPDARYLAIIQPTVGHDAVATLSVWDSRRGTIRRLAENVPTFVSAPYWSHDSSRVAINTGQFDSIKDHYPDLEIVNLAGQVVKLGKGEMASWSPDDRLVAAISPNTCGANTCDENELIYPSSGGRAVLLMKHSSSDFDNPSWAPQPTGYAFDRWLLNRSGHITRTLAGRNERIDSWAPDGLHLALQTYYPYQGTPDVLSIAQPSGRRVRIYQDGRNSGCGACSKDVYSVTWSHDGRSFAFSTPTHPTPRNVTVSSSVFLSPIAGGTRIRIQAPGSDYIEVMAFVEQDRELVVRDGGAVYRYVIARRQLTPIVSGLRLASAVEIDPRAIK
ncbi:MAG: hypothetical protein M3Z66_00720 [Chloroflexota bacterium]|nr:hypothetical protein [Chloroflexota bacterium]